MKLKRKRIFKKRLKRFMDWFTREKIPAAFADESERKQFVSAFARRQVGQSYHFPERLVNTYAASKEDANGG